jgi:pimeloyl-ACP methyl ester carboxylesterase
VPVLFVVGARDPVVRPEHVRAQMADYPGSSLWVVPRASHTTSIVVEPEEFVRRVTGVLEQAGFTPAGRETVESG